MYSGVLEAAGPACEQWLCSPAFEERLFSYFPCADPLAAAGVRRRPRRLPVVQILGFWAGVKGSMLCACTGALDPRAAALAPKLGRAPVQLLPRCSNPRLPQPSGARTCHTGCAYAFSQLRQY